MPQDKTTASYMVTASLIFIPVNKYGDELGPQGSLSYTVSTEVTGLGGLAGILNGLDALFTGRLPL